MTEPKPFEQYNFPEPVLPSSVTLTRDEIKMLLRIRQASSQGRMILLDPDSGTLWLLGKPEHVGVRKMVIDFS